MRFGKDQEEEEEGDIGEDELMGSLFNSYSNSPLHPFQPPENDQLEEEEEENKSDTFDFTFSNHPLPPHHHYTKYNNNYHNYK